MKNKGIIKTTCNSCGKSSDNGIILKGKFICRNCEMNIVNLDVNNDPQYDFYVRKIKDMLFN